MSRTLFLEPRVILSVPLIVTHAEWCAWLSTHGSLSPEHRGCVNADRCVAIK